MAEAPKSQIFTVIVVSDHSQAVRKFRVPRRWLQNVGWSGVGLALFALLTVGHYVSLLGASGENSVLKEENAQLRSQVLLVGSAFRAQVVDVADDSVVLECSGSAEKLAALAEALRPYGLLELSRTGALAMARGAAPALVPKAHMYDPKGRAEETYPPLAMSV